MLMAFFGGVVGGVTVLALLRLFNIAWRVQLVDADDVRRRLDALEAGAAAPAIALDEATKLAYQHAGDWLRMVNTITWTINSLFVTGAIIAFNSGWQATGGTALHWKHTIGWIVVVLCAVWVVADITYFRSARIARSILRQSEDTFPVDRLRLYSGPRVGPWPVPDLILWCLFQVLSFVPVSGIAFLAITEFIQAR